VIDPSSNAVTKTITGIGPATGGEPRGIAISNNGNDSDADETVYVTNFYSFANNKLDGEDDSKTGLVTKISTQTDTVTGRIVLKNRGYGLQSYRTPSKQVQREGTQRRPQGHLYHRRVPNQMQAIGVKVFPTCPCWSVAQWPGRFNVTTRRWSA
jgi:hypothetical protein